MEPASSIIARFAQPERKLTGEAVVSEITGTAYTAPYRWQYPVEKKGTGGRIPQRHHPAMLDYARKKGIQLKAEDFVMPLRRQPQRPRSPAAA